MSLLKPNSKEVLYFYDTRQYNTVCASSYGEKKLSFLNNSLLAVKQPSGSGDGRVWRVLEDYQTPGKYPVIGESYIVVNGNPVSYKDLNHECLKLLPIVEVEVKTDEYGQISTVLDTPRIFMNFNEAIKDNNVKKDLFKGDDEVENLALFNLVPRLLPDFLYQYNPIQVNDKTRFFMYLVGLGVGLYGGNEWRKNGLNVKNGIFTGVGVYSGVQLSRAFARNPKFVFEIFKK